MSETISTAGIAAAARPRSAARAAVWRAPGTRRRLQLALAFIWLVDAVLQYQPYMFTKAFGQGLAGTAAGNPAVIADPITWAARIVTEHPVGTNAAFATIQLLLAFGIAWRPTLRVALACSVLWSVAVWWFGEGLGGVLDGGASPVMGGPGAVILYALLAVLLWPPRDGQEEDESVSFIAARPVGAVTAKGLWLLLWGSLAYFAVVPGTGAQGLHDMIAGMGDGNPRWLSSVMRVGADAVAGRGMTVSWILAAALAVVALGVFLPRPAARTTLVLAIAVALVIWVFGEALGELFTTQATDVNSGPLLVLLALAYWPLRAVRTSGEQPVPAQAAATADQEGD